MAAIQWYFPFWSKWVGIQWVNPTLISCYRKVPMNNLNARIMFRTAWRPAKNAKNLTERRIDFWWENSWRIRRRWRLGFSRGSRGSVGAISWNWNVYTKITYNICCINLNYSTSKIRITLQRLRIIRLLRHTRTARVTLTYTGKYFFKQNTKVEIGRDNNFDSIFQPVSQNS